MYKKAIPGSYKAIDTEILEFWAHFAAHFVVNFGYFGDKLTNHWEACLLSISGGSFGGP